MSRPPLGPLVRSTVVPWPCRNVAIGSQGWLASPVEFHILGPVEAHDGGRRLAIGGPKQRALLAVLLLARTAPVTRDRLIEALWGERPPATVSHTLDAYLSRLRKLVGADRLTRNSGGYVLRVEQGELDLDRLRRAHGARPRSSRGRQGRPRRQTSCAPRSLSGGVKPWPMSCTSRSATRLRRGWRHAVWLRVEERIEAELACGRAGELVGELEELLRREPFRERLLAQLMLALYRSGQPARALEAYRAARHRLADELGLEPGRSLQELERAMLTQDPALEPPTRAMLTQDPALEPPARAHPVRRASRRRRWMILGVAACVLAALTAGAVIQLQGPENAPISRVLRRDHPAREERSRAARRGQPRESSSGDRIGIRLGLGRRSERRHRRANRPGAAHRRRPDSGRWDTGGDRRGRGVGVDGERSRRQCCPHRPGHRNGDAENPARR